MQPRIHYFSFQILIEVHYELFKLNETCQDKLT